MSARQSIDGISRSGAAVGPAEMPLFVELDAAMAHYEHQPEALIQVLHRAQELFGYLRDDVIRHIGCELRIPLSRIHGVIGFYSFFSRVPQGKHSVTVCTGTACYVRGADRVLTGLQKVLGIAPGGTTNDGRFSLRCARCVGACGLAPVLMIGDDVHGSLDPKRLKTLVRQYK